MRKFIVAINITLDGFCDHTAGIADEELHDYYADILETVDTSIMGRITYQLMEDYWPKVARDKSGTDAEIRFAVNLDKMERFVVSKTLTKVNWDGTTVIRDSILEEVKKIKHGSGSDVLIGGPSLIYYLTMENLIDEFYFAVHPVILGEGKKLFSVLNNQVNLELIELRRFNSGVISCHYKIKPISDIND